MGAVVHGIHSAAARPAALEDDADDRLGHLASASLTSASASSSCRYVEQRGQVDLGQLLRLQEQRHLWRRQVVVGLARLEVLANVPGEPLYRRVPVGPRGRHLGAAVPAAGYLLRGCIAAGQQVADEQATAPTHFVHHVQLGERNVIAGQVVPHLARGTDYGNFADIQSRHCAAQRELGKRVDARRKFRV